MSQKLQFWITWWSPDYFMTFSLGMQSKLPSETLPNASSEWVTISAVVVIFWRPLLSSPEAMESLLGMEAGDWTLVSARWPDWLFEGVSNSDAGLMSHSSAGFVEPQMLTGALPSLSGECSGIMIVSAVSLYRFWNGQVWSFIWVRRRNQIQNIRAVIWTTVEGEKRCSYTMLTVNYRSNLS